MSMSFIGNSGKTKSTSPGNNMSTYQVPKPVLTPIVLKPGPAKKEVPFYLRPVEKKKSEPVVVKKETKKETKKEEVQVSQPTTEVVSGGGESSYSPVYSEPPAPPAVEVSYIQEAIKIATSNLIINDKAVPTIEEMANLVFEDIGGRELISLSRNDLINGDDVDYQPIKNLGEIKEAYNSQNLISLQSTLNDYFRKFPMELDSFIPASGTGLNKETIYVDSTTGNLIIDLINLDDDLEVEIQVFDSGMILSDTID